MSLTDDWKTAGLGEPHLSRRDLFDLERVAIDLAALGGGDVVRARKYIIRYMNETERKTRLDTLKACAMTRPDRLAQVVGEFVHTADPPAVTFVPAMVSRAEAEEIIAGMRELSDALPRDRPAALHCGAGAYEYLTHLYPPRAGSATDTLWIHATMVIRDLRMPPAAWRLDDQDNKPMTEGTFGYEFCETTSEGDDEKETYDLECLLPIRHQGDHFDMKVGFWNE